ncbi:MULTISPECIES: hypothetical protein [unclassified Streptomyces]|uniref:hypothetical protein n=1 Tax=unclassified Streptomyces TaxID=2593676 RepID=UPI0036E3D2D6
MSRETDSPSSGPNGRGGAAYPSGTPPYGTPMASDDGTDAVRSGTQSEERKTETTLTTRIRINIPGSRPIPPVVVRTPVADAEPTAPAAAEAPAPGAPTGTVAPPADPAPPAEEKASNWFAPRKSGPPKGGQGGGATNGAGAPGGSGAAPAGSGAAPGGARPGPAAGRPGGVVGAMSVPGGSRPGGGTNGAGLPGATGGPVAPGHGGGTGSFDVTEALGNGPRPGGEPRRDELPYFAENGDGGQNGQHGQGGQGGYGAQGSPGGANGYGPSDDFNSSTGSHSLDGLNDFNSSTGSHRFDASNDFNGPNDFAGPNGRGGPQGPAGPTGGPVTGDGPLVPPVNGGPGGPGGPGAYGGPAAPGGPGGHRRPGGPGGPGGPAGPGIPGAPGGPGGQQRPGGPGAPGGFGGPGAPGGMTGLAGPGAGTLPGAGPHGGPGGPGRAPGGGLSDDTAILTPQKPAPEPGTPGYGTPGYGTPGAPPDNVSGHTVTSGIPVVPPGTQNAPFGPGAPSDGPMQHTVPKLPEPVAQNVPASSKKAKKKGRNKLVLIATGVFVIAAGAYGAGLLMNRSDVPKGTTVLGVDIGGGTRDDAVKKLDAEFGDRVNKPLKLSVGGKTVELKPDQAGLQFDETATVAVAAQSDYNPMSVIGSLFGNHRIVEPNMPVDEEKLTAALKDAGGSSGSVTEGTIKFTAAGKAVAVYGKAGKGIDVAKSTTAVEEAYRTQVETGSVGAVPVATTTQQPSITNAEVDRMMKEFAKPAMSEVVTITGGSTPIQFGAVSLPKILGVKAVDGKLVETYDLEALKEAYGSVFDGVKVKTATGERDVLPQDVVSVLRKVLLGKTTAERTGAIETNPS